ncbi:MAG TPA: hypothetical protein VE030_11020 [Burkholderiales bacterium]|nr:hypothetical protein [Burkholderiales bacterium]
MTREPTLTTFCAACAACIAGRRHAPEEVQAHHPFSGHGFSPEVGWTDPRLEPKPTTLHSWPMEYDPTPFAPGETAVVPSTKGRVA